jgi:PAS domain S-box-containing protein
MRNDKNEVVGTRGVIQDITQAKKLQLELEISRKNIESSLQLAEKNQRSMTEASTLAKIGYWEYYEVNETFIWSDYMYQIFGLDLKDNIPSQQELMNCLDKKSLKKLNQAISDLTEKGSSYDLELKIHNFKNEELWIRRLVQPIYNHHNEIIGRRGMMQNITDSKNTLLELKTAKEAAEKTLVLAEKSEYSMNEAGKMAKIGYWEYDKEKVALSWSDAVHNIYGSDPKNGVPTLIQILSVYTEESRKKLVEATSNLTNNGVSYHIDLELINFKKEKIWIRDLAQPVYNHKNKIIGRRGMTQDITDIKNTQLEILKAKEKIESNELKFKSYTENSPITIYTTNLEGEWIYVNQNWTEMTGMSPEESLGKRWMNALHPNDVELVRDKWFGSLASRGKWKYEYRFISKTGEILWVEGTARELFNDKNELIGHLGVNVNITERKKAEENLVVTSERLRLATNSAKMGIWDWDILDDQLTWDNKMFELYGVEKDGNSADLKLWQKSVHPDDFEKASKDLEKALSGEQDFNSKFRIIRSDKSIHFIEGTAVVLRDNDGNAIRMIGINVDVTERKKAEQEKNNLQKTLENSLNEIYIFDSETLQFSYANKGALLNLGYSETEIKLITPIDLKPEFTETHFKELIAPLINGAKNKIIFFTNHQRKDGSLYPAEVHLQFFTQGNDKGFLSVVLDITERKKAEEMYRLLSNHTNDLICMHDIDSTFTYISKSIKNLLGFEQNELLQKKVFEIVHQEDIEPLKKILAERIFKGVSTDAFAFRARHKNGHYLWLEAVSSPVIKNNKIVSFVTSTRNINQWMLAKQDVEEYQSSLQKLTTEVALIVEKQKKEIATNIHDQLSESLVISKMRISALEKRTELKSAFEDFDFIKSQISKALENSRKITYELSPPILYQLGLIEALDWFAEDTQEKHGIEFQFSSNIPMLPIDEFKSILIYRCIQEVVNNAIKYAAASLLTLECIKEEKAIVIFVKDNGKGFDTSILKKASKSDTGFGLFAVQERIRSMEGDFTVKSEINKGTTIKIYLPL